MQRYSILVRILDRLCAEASGTKWASLYAVGSKDEEAIAQARARAFIHLYLKVMFGEADFARREHCITDGGYDGGIDGYYIDTETKCIYLVQAKFRRTHTNFEGKIITPEELLVMDIDRVLAGELTDEDGNSYNGKIQGLQRAVRDLPDITRYTYVVVVLANVRGLTPSDLRRLTGGYRTEVFDFQRCYRELVLPVVSGTYFQASDLTLSLDLRNKSPSGKISYSVDTALYECEITVVFVPTYEIARVMDRYRNSVLRYNPRSYLDLEGHKVNNAIRDTIRNTMSNEFALLNNGLTILSDETDFNEKVGVKNQARIRLVNPQIINGGQTAYTLSRIFNDLAEDDRRAVFDDKEVLVKVITLTLKDGGVDSGEERTRLIESISEATNRQTPVSAADRHSNDEVHIEAQQALFDAYGLFYERKRGEFSDGLKAGYISPENVLERNLFLRILLTVEGDISRALSKRIFAQFELTPDRLNPQEKLDKFYAGYRLFARLNPKTSVNPKTYRDVLAKVFIAVATSETPDPSDADEWAFTAARRLDGQWEDLLRSISQRRPRIVSRILDPETGETRMIFNPEKWLRSGTLGSDLAEFVRSQSSPAT